jgi:hypothetical protein
MMRLFIDGAKTIATSLAVIALMGCGKPSTRGSSGDAASDQFPNSQSQIRKTADGEQRRAELLNRIRAADPSQATIVRALLNEKNELGLVLNRTVELDDVPKLLRTMLGELDKSFPGQDHTAVAYAPTNPPQPIGTARLDGRTRVMTYTRANAP